MAFCSNCGTKAPDGVKFCPECGARILTAVQMNAAEAPVVEQPAPTPAVEEPIPAPVVEEPAPAPVAEEPVPAEEQPAAASAAPVKFDVGEDGLEYVPYVPVENPQPLVLPGTKPAAKKTAPAAEQLVSAPKAAKAPKEPKKGIKKFLPFIIIGAAALLALLIGVIVLVVSIFKGLGGKMNEATDPNLGRYNAVSAEMMGMEMDVEDIWNGGFGIELQENGEAVLYMNGTEESAEWTLEDGIFGIEGGGAECSGTLENGELVLDNVMGLEVKVTFVKDGAAIDAPDAPAALPGGDMELSALQEQWNGLWFGGATFMEGTGKYKGYSDMTMDAFISIDVDADGRGTMRVYLGQDAGMPAFASAEIQAADYGIDVVSGEILSFGMNTDWWMFRPIPDFPDCYVMSDYIGDEDGDTCEYMIFMKKWGDSWQPEVDAVSSIVPESVAYYEEEIAFGMDAPVISDNTAVALTLREAIGSPLDPNAPVQPREIALPSNWYGWVEFTNWWGNDEADSLIDAWGSAAIDDNNDETPYYEIYLDDVDTAFYSVYMTLEDDATVIRPMADGYSWVGDLYLEPGQEDDYCLYLRADGMLCAEFAYVSATGEYGCDVMMCFREHGQLWDEYEDRLPPRYDEYVELLEHEKALEVLETMPEGDGIVASIEKLNEGFDLLYNSDFGITYAEVREMFGGVDGEPSTWESDFHAYHWKTADGSGSVAVSFNVDEAGLETYCGISWSGDVGE